MREYHILQGISRGIYNIYDSKEEFLKTGFEYKEWHNNSIDYDVGDWIHTTDGCFLQILRKREYIYKKINKRILQFRVCTQFIAKYFNLKTTTISESKCLGLYSNRTTRFMHADDISKLDKISFVALVKSGFTLEDSARKAVMPNKTIKSTAKGMALELITDPYVQNRLRIDNIKIKSDDFEKYLLEFMEHVDKGSQEQLESIRIMYNYLKLKS